MDAYGSTGQGFLGYNMFAYCENNPISFEDASGQILKPTQFATEDDLEQYYRALEYIRSTEVGAALIERLERAQEVFIVIFRDDHQTKFLHSKDVNYIYFDPYSGMVLDDGISTQSAAMGLAHEMGHGAQYLDGKSQNNCDLEADVLATYETPIAKELGEPIREKYIATWGVTKMNNSTHFIVAERISRPWCYYFFFWNWFSPKYEAVQHNEK